MRFHHALGGAALALRLVVSATLLAAIGCRPSPAPPTSPPAASPAPTAARATRPGALSREQLLQDARQLARIIEDTHPDPYLNGGGRLAFHRRLHRVLNAIPDEGMTRDEFYRLVRPFVAAVGDMHTGFLGGYKTDADRPGGVPLRLSVVEQLLVVRGVERGREEYLGAKLLSVEGVPVAELAARQRQLQGVDNQYHALQLLAERSLAFRPYMQDLLPEWKDPRQVRVELKRQDGTVNAVVLREPGANPVEVNPPSRVSLPQPDDSGFRTAFLEDPSSGREVAYIRFAHMGGYRETREQRQPLVSVITRPRSATAAFRTLVGDMKARGTDTLILDVRDNHGGNSLISEMLVYFLYGRDALLKMAGVGTGEIAPFRYSRLYFEDRPDESLAEINKDRAVPLVEGDYDFSWSFVDGRPIARLLGPEREPPIVRFVRLSPTFREEFDAGTYAGHYAPRRVIVLCNAGTMSAGFSVVSEFDHFGALTVGTPSSQAPNSYGAAAVFTLTHTGLRGMVPMVSATHFADDSSKARVLPLDYPMTYERLASYRFDPNAEYLYALTLK
jgi:hypothetical protein